jgi:hypothetical protein
MRPLSATVLRKKDANSGPIAGGAPPGRSIPVSQQQQEDFRE